MVLTQMVRDKALLVEEIQLLKVSPVHCLQMILINWFQEEMENIRFDRDEMAARWNSSRLEIEGLDDDKLAVKALSTNLSGECKAQAC